MWHDMARCEAMWRYVVVCVKSMCRLCGIYVVNIGHDEKNIE